MLGGVGSGKTTELWRVHEHLATVAQDSGDVAQYIDVAAEHRLDRMRAGVLVALAGRRLVRVEERVRRARGETAVPKEVAKARDAVEKLADGYDRELPPDTGPPDDWEPPDDWNEGTEFEHIPGVIEAPQPPLSTRVSESIPHLRTLRDAIVGTQGHCVFLFDSLDRVKTPAAFEAAVRDDLRALKRANLGAVVVGPIQFQYGAGRAIGELVDNNVHFVREIEPENEGLTFLADMLAKRVSDEMLSAEGRAMVARASGGVLRDLVAIGKLSAEEAYVAGATTIRPEDIERAMDRFGRGRAVGLDSAQVTALRKVAEKKTFVIRNDRDVALLETRRILDWGGGRFVVHPTLEPLLGAMTEVP
ncbi:Hypothetical protein I5071_52710 [Sandaracinus amylolyticus]|nr:Hypothetical protein I5071_52710 [Sandaracinus amylolyticus]